MAICRVQKTKNYTVMSNYHLDDIRLSLKAVGLLSKILRLPDDWDFSIKGLAKISHDGADCIESALKELETYHYIKRERLRDEKGHMGKMLYTIYEIPYDVDKADWLKPQFVSAGNKVSPPDRDFPVQALPDMGYPDRDIPDQDIPDVDKPDMDFPERDNPAQINTYSPIPKKNKDKRNKYSINQSFPVKEDGLNELRQKTEYQRFVDENRALDEKLERDEISMEEFSEHYTNLRVLDMILETVSEVTDENSPAEIVLGKQRIRREVLKDRFLRLSHTELKEITRTLVEKQPKNRRSYALMVIYNY